MRNFGLKIFSTNLQNAPQFIKECAEYCAARPDMFIEIMAIADSTTDDFKQIKQQLGNIKIRIHSSYIGFDAGNPEQAQQNKKILAVAQKAADIFASPSIIVHAGYGHGKKYIAETARQFRLFNDSRIVVENLPYYDNNGDNMHGCTAEEIGYIMQTSGCGFCFDFSHAICAAQDLHINIETQLQNFYALKPTVYHMCDGNTTQAKDLHLHFGCGNYPLSHYLNDLTAPDACITIETGEGIPQHVDKAVQDYLYLKSLS